MTLHKFVRTLFVCTLLLAAPSFIALAAGSKKDDCYFFMHKIKADKFISDESTDIVYKSFDSEIPIVRAFEKEGLFYEDIAVWFPKSKPETKDYLRKRLEDEIAGKKPRHLTRFLIHWDKKYRPPKLFRFNSGFWESKGIREKLEFVLAGENAFDYITVKGRSELFLDGVLNFDFLMVSKETPSFITVGDDLGSYEVKTIGGLEKQKEYLKLRENTEEFMEGKVGHQHLVHGWPKTESERKKISEQYVELLDASTWFLFWRQMKRNPYEVESIVEHPFLGVYTRESLERLNKAMVEGDVSRFKNKFRMVGARTLKADEKIEGQISQGLIIPDFELRSGNKGMSRDFIEDMIQSRFITGDYSGLLKFNSYEFNPNASITEILSPFLSSKKIAVIEEFEKVFPMMKYSSDVRAYNHYRNKIISPLLPWENRLVIGEKIHTLQAAQKKYAESLYIAAENYIKTYKRLRNIVSKSELREETQFAIEKAGYRFSDKVRLDLDLERYLKPKPKSVPNVLLAQMFEINEMNLGIEYSFRFPENVTNRETAEAHIKLSIENFKKEMGGGGAIQKVSEGGHGHGLSIRYTYTDAEGKVWRFEWDGVLREYTDDGIPINPYGGHMEVPTPKYSPQSLDEIQKLYNACRSAGLSPKRSAGGAHVNIDLEQFLALEPKVGARKMVDFINYFESNRELVAFIWQHPSRARVAIPVERTPGLEKALSEFSGDWNDLALVLYKHQYFNPYIGRKPRYIQLNVTSLITPVAPKKYRADLGNVIDIKNPTQEWFPEFGTGTGRVEFRLFDAPEDEYMAGLQIKYVRALLNKALNGSSNIPLKPRFNSSTVDTWKGDAKTFITAAKEHLSELGLDYNEFEPLLIQSWNMQQYVPEVKPALQKYNKFLPPSLEK